MLIKFPQKLSIDKSKPLYEGPEIVGIPREHPENGKEYLSICKNVLENEDYIDVLVGILDIEHYASLEPDLKLVVDHYHAYEGNIK